MLGVMTRLFRRSVLTIAVGREYIIRSGQTIQIVGEDNTSFKSLAGYCFIDNNGRNYNREGRLYHEFRFQNPGQESPFDIVDYV